MSDTAIQMNNALQHGPSLFVVPLRFHGIVGFFLALENRIGHAPDAWYIDCGMFVLVMGFGLSERFVLFVTLALFMRYGR